MSDAAEALRQDGDGVRLAIRVVARAGRTCVAGLYEDGSQPRLRVGVAAAPVEGRANQELLDFVARILGVARSSAAVVSGERSRNKVIRIAPLSLADAAARLGAALGALEIARRHDDGRAGPVTRPGG